jgi:hypothetical protein
MASMDERDICTKLGLEAPPAAEPSNRIEHTMRDLDALQEKHDALIEGERQPGETHEAAAARLYQRTPLYSVMKKAKAQILARNKIGDGASGGL